MRISQWCVIYKIKCICGEFYVGEWKKKLNQVKRTQGSIHTCCFRQICGCEQAWQEGHKIEWNDLEILDTAKDLHERKVKETLYIRRASKSCLINKDKGRELLPLRIRTIKNSEKRDHTTSLHPLWTPDRVSPNRYLECTTGDAPYRTAIWRRHPPQTSADHAH